MRRLLEVSRNHETAADPERLEQCQREARAVAALCHANVVTIWVVEEAEHIHVTAMELLERRMLADPIPERGFMLWELRIILSSTLGRRRCINFSVERDMLGAPRTTRGGRNIYCTRRVAEADIWLIILP